MIRRGTLLPRSAPHSRGWRLGGPSSRAWRSPALRQVHLRLPSGRLLFWRAGGSAFTLQPRSFSGTRGLLRLVVRGRGRGPRPPPEVRVVAGPGLRASLCLPLPPAHASFQVATAVPAASQPPRPPRLHLLSRFAATRGPGRADRGRAPVRGAAAVLWLLHGAGTPGRRFPLFLLATLFQPVLLAPWTAGAAAACPPCGLPPVPL